MVRIILKAFGINEEINDSIKININDRHRLKVMQ